MIDKKKTIGIAIAAGLALLAIGYFVGRAGRGRHDHEQAAATGGQEAEATVWTCSMHPQIKQPSPGDCPICGMDLIPLEEESSEVGPRELKLSEAAEKLADIRVMPARRKEVVRTVRLVGKVEYDETRVATISAWVGGRLDRLYVDYTGIPVKEGDHMVYLYSPQILTAQEELIQAIKAEREIRDSALPSIRKSSRTLVEAAREKLRLWGLSKEQIKEIEEGETAGDHITINAPIGGIVVHKNAEEGEYVKTGTPIYRIADLSKVWVKLDAYEADLPWLRYGQEVVFKSEAHPGHEFSGRIAFIDPVLNEKTRTVKVRVNVDNPGAKLKPGMFVRAEVRAVLGEDGKVFDRDLAGKWISPMHPEIVKDGPGKCDVCGMPLVPVEDLGFVSDENHRNPLVTPASAVLLTGTRAVVYVKGDKPGIYAGREIVLGPRADGFYVVADGLSEGEKVVTHGNFKIDSALQIVAKPSMMSPAEDDATAEAAQTEPMPVTRQEDVPDAFIKQLEPLFDRYFAISTALGKDDADTAKAEAGALLKELSKVDMSLVTGDAHKNWMKIRTHLRDGAKEISMVGDIDDARLHFKSLSIAMKSLSKSFGTGKKEVYLNVCPMAFDNTGAQWLQSNPQLLNPYFGSMMPACGDRVEIIGTENKEKKHEGSHKNHE